MKRFAILLLAVSSMGASAPRQDVRYGDWILLRSIPDVKIAKTINEAGMVAGIVCNMQSRTCSAYFSAGIQCENGKPYPAMVNSALGASATLTTCTIIEKQAYLEAKDFAGVKSAFESGGEVGFAVPMASGQFKVVRFSTVGATAAITEAMRLEEPAASNKPKAEEIL